MAQPYIGEIRIFAGNFAPAGWAMCDGQLMSIAENDALFSLIGTTYGGDGQETFAVPDLRGRLPTHQGNGPGQSFIMGQQGGAEQTTLTVQQVPIHSHTFLASADPANSPNPGAHVVSEPLTTLPFIQDVADSPLNAQSLTTAGGNQPHENVQPYLCINYIISLFGIYPSPT